MAANVTRKNDPSGRIHVRMEERGTSGCGAARARVAAKPFSRLHRKGKRPHVRARTRGPSGPVRSAAGAPPGWHDPCPLAAPLGDYPARLTERLEHWAEHAPERARFSPSAPDGAWRRLTYAETLEGVAHRPGAARPRAFGRATARDLLGQRPRACAARARRPARRRFPTLRSRPPTRWSRRISASCVRSST